MNRIPSSSARQFRFTCCGYTVDTVWLTIYNGADALVTSATASNSGAGFYWAVVTVPGTVGFYQGIWHAYYGTDAASNAALYKTPDRFEVVLEQVDW